MFDADIKINLSDINSNYNDPKADLGNRTAWKFEVPFFYQFDIHWSLVFNPWYEYSSIGKSDTFTITNAGKNYMQVYQPASRIHQYGLNLGLRALF